MYSSIFKNVVIFTGKLQILVINIIKCITLHLQPLYTLYNSQYQLPDPVISISLTPRAHHRMPLIITSFGFPRDRQSIDKV